MGGYSEQSERHAGERPFRSLVESLDGHAIYRLDATGYIQTWNRGAVSITGYEPQAIRGRHVSTCYPPAAVDAGIPEETLAAARADGSVDVEGWRVRADGSQFWAAVTVTAIRGDDGELTGYAVLMNDRTEQRETDSRRRLSADISRGLAEAETLAGGLEHVLATLCTQTAATYGEAWVPIESDSRTERVAVASEETGVGGSRPETADATTRFRLAVLAEHVTATGDTAWAGNDARRVSCLSSAGADSNERDVLGVPLVDDGVVVAVVVLSFPAEATRNARTTIRETVEAVVTNLGTVVGRKRAETTLERERAFLDKLIETSPVGIVVAESDGTIARVNDHVERLFGLSEHDVLGRRYTELGRRIYDESGTELTIDAFPVTEAFERRESLTDYEFGITRFDGEERWLSVSATPVPAADGTVRRVVAAVRDITARKRHERSLERVQAVTESVRPLYRALNRASTRGEIERAVCEQLAASDAYRFAWYGTYNPAAHRVTPTACCGEAFEPLEDCDEIAAERWDALDDALGSGEVSVASLGPTKRLAPWADDSPETEYETVAAVPIVFDDVVYGVLCLYSERQNAFDEYERSLLSELGERVGHALAAARTMQLLHTDSAVELEFRTSASEAICAGISAALDCRLTLEAMVPTAANRFLGYLDVAGAEPTAVCDKLLDASTVTMARVVSERATTGTIEYVTVRSPTTTLITAGATVRSAVADGGVETIRAEVAPDAAIDEITDRMQATYANTSFVAKRTLDRPVQTHATDRQAVDDVLTDRQREVLELAYHAGFFESPRESTGEELAQSLGISSPTFYVHVRTALRKILHQLIDEQREK